MTEEVKQEAVEHEANEPTESIDLDKAIEEAQNEAAPEDEVEEQAPEPTDEGDEDDSDTDTDGDGEEEQVEKPEASQNAEESQAEDEKLEPPSHWNAELKDDFNSLPSEAQAPFKKAMDNLWALHTKRSQELAEIRKDSDAINQMFDPYKEQMRIAGEKPTDVVNRFIGIHEALSRGGDAAKQAVDYIVKNYNVPFEPSGQLREAGENAEYGDSQNAVQQPNVVDEKAVLDMVNNQFAQREYNSRLHAFQEVEQEFATDALNYPHWDKVYAQMGKFLPDNVPVAKAKEAYAQAYESAVYADPTLREELISSQVNSKVNKTQSQMQEEVTKAKKASRNMKSDASAAKAPAKITSIDDAIDAAIEEANAATG